MNKIPKRAQIIKEKKDDISGISETSIKEFIKHVHLDLIKDLNDSEISKEVILKEDMMDSEDLIANFIPDIIQKEKERIPSMEEELGINPYDYNINNDLEYINDLYQKHDTEKGLALIENVLHEYKDKLKQTDKIDLILKKTKLLEYKKDLTSAIKTVEELHKSIPLFTQDQKTAYYLVKGMVYFDKAIQFLTEARKNKEIESSLKTKQLQQTLGFFLKSRESYEMTVEVASSNKQEGAQLDTSFYKNIMFRLALCNHELFKLPKNIYKIYDRLHSIEECDTILSEIRNIPEENNINFTAQILYLHGLVYKDLGEDKKAIDSFKEYLTHRPDDEKAKILIKKLSEQSGK